MPALARALVLFVAMAMLGSSTTEGVPEPKSLDDRLEQLEGSITNMMPKHVKTIIRFIKFSSFH